MLSAKCGRRKHPRWLFRHAPRSLQAFAESMLPVEWIQRCLYVDNDLFELVYGTCDKRTKATPYLSHVETNMNARKRAVTLIAVRLRKTVRTWKCKNLQHPA